jgi:pimeloyl-ACP methyl ester carboxylesterase
VPEQQLANGVTLHLVDEGEGRPVVFIHGVAMSSRFFDRQIAHVSAHARMLAPDLRGHGRSEKVLHGHTVENYAADLAELFAERGIERPVLVGWSLGAMVAWEYLRAFGQTDVAGLVIVEQPPSDWAWDGYEFGSITPEVLAELVAGLQMAPAAVAEELAHLMQHEPDDETTSWMVEEITSCPPAIASTILANQTLRDYRSLLPDITLPTAVFFGADDKMTSPQAGEWIASVIPGATLTLFERSSHVPFLEEADAFNEALDAFIAGLEEAS